LISIIGLVYIAFFHTDAKQEEQKSRIYTLNDFLFLFILVEFLFFSWTIVTRIATILGIRVFCSGRLPGSPLDRKDDAHSGAALEIRGQLEGDDIQDDEDGIDFDDHLQSEDRYN
jgi:hypothetical protein